MPRRSWGDLSRRQKLGIRILALLQVTLLALAQWDLQKRSDEELRGSKAMWRVLVFVNFLGPLAYFVVGRKAAGE